ncbi:hypothetical protein F5878DRAFT_661131 [Lentinula raphanica]|uniref:Uncharacterized protein n=1 Tax=Lentinula raphanica TaxID=153919 RepID=A0AA38P984_9AGAR|nr:hypothetical protein F5878DRAFT_661131 [Lentinula raphanica]
MPKEQTTPLSHRFHPIVQTRRNRRGKRSAKRRVERAERNWSKKADAERVFLDKMPGRYMEMKADGKKLTEALSRDYPNGSLQLDRAPMNGRLLVEGMALSKELKPTVVTVLRRFMDIITPEEQLEIERLWLLMQEKGLKYSRKRGESNRSATPAIHAGIWEKFAREPRLTAETWKMQNREVKKLMAQLIGILSSKVAPRMAALLQTYYPEVWERQKRALLRVRKVLASEFAEMPWLDFGGAFFAVAIKTGCSERDHLDWSDDKYGLTWVSGVGNWEGADLRALETGMQYPLRPGEAILANMRQMVHSASPILSGQRITLTFFTCSFLARHSEFD